MPDAPAPAAKKKIGPFTPLGWGGITAGVLGVWWYMRRRQAASAAATATGTTDGQTTPGLAGGSTTPSSGLPSFNSLSDWQQAALSTMTGAGYPAAAAWSDLSAWLGGGCVSAPGYNALGNVLTSVGLPPGFGTSLGPLTVCSDASQPSTTPQAPTGAPAGSPSPTVIPTAPPAPTPAPTPIAAPAPTSTIFGTASGVPSGFEVDPAGQPFLTAQQFAYQITQPLSAANIAASGQGGPNDLSGLAALNNGTGPTPAELAYFDSLNAAKKA